MKRQPENPLRSQIEDICGEVGDAKRWLSLLDRRIALPNYDREQVKWEAKELENHLRYLAERVRLLAY